MADNKPSNTEKKEDEVGVVPEHTELPDAPLSTKAKPMSLPMESSTNGKSGNKNMMLGLAFIVSLTIAVIVLMLSR